MRYKRKANRHYSPTHIKKRQFYEALRLKPVGEWSQGLLSFETGKVLQKKHWDYIVKELKKVKPPQNRKRLVELLKKAANTPQQRFVVLYETSLRRPLAYKEFVEYLKLFKENFPEPYKTLYGKKTPDKIASECVRDWTRVKG